MHVKISLAYGSQGLQIQVRFKYLFTQTCMHARVHTCVRPHTDPCDNNFANQNNNDLFV